MRAGSGGLYSGKFHPIACARATIPDNVDSICSGGMPSLAKTALADVLKDSISLAENSTGLGILVGTAAPPAS